MHPLYAALPVPYVPVWVTHVFLVAQINTYAPPHYRTSQYRRAFIPLSVSLWNDFAEPVFDGVGLAGAGSMLFYLSKLLAHFLSSNVSPLFFFSHWVGIDGLGSSD